MRVCLVRAPSCLGVITSTSNCHQPINLAYLASSLRSSGHAVTIVDYEVGQGMEAIAAGDPRLVGITLMTPQYASGAAIAREVKERLPGAFIVAGGPHPSALPVDLLEEVRWYDAAVVGEGEERLTALAGALENASPIGALPGIAVREGRAVRYEAAATPYVEDLDSLPEPARDLLPLHLYTGASSPGIAPAVTGTVAEIFTSRGCPYRCAFCASTLVHGTRVRARSLDKVLAEMRRCMDQYGARHFNILDEVFTLDRARVLGFCDGIRPLGPGWNCETRVDRVDPELLLVMRKAGCVKVSYGIESGSERIIEFLSKGITVSGIEKAFRWTREAGIQSMAYVMIGAHPDEGPEDLRLTKRLVRRIDPDFATFSIATPFPGTVLHQRMKAQGLILSERWEGYALFNRVPSWRTRHLTPRDLYRIHRSLHAWFYLRPGYAVRRLARLKSLSEARYWAKAGMAMLRYVFGSPR